MLSGSCNHALSRVMRSESGRDVLSDEVGSSKKSEGLGETNVVISSALYYVEVEDHTLSWVASAAARLFVCSRWWVPARCVCSRMFR